MYAIIDIETTGTSYKTGKITEIAILLHDGMQVVDKFVTLLNPEREIPWRITQLTGINDRMVEHAPKFFEVARKIVEFTEGCTIVAHNAHFDYNFIREEFRCLGYTYKRNLLCTVKLSRKLIPFRKSYSLSNLCEYLHIENFQRHRAEGDATATARVFEILIDIDPELDQLDLRGLNSKLDRQLIDSLPEETGVYYFHRDDGRIIYIGKSINIRNRVLSHLSNNLTKKGQEMKNLVSDITYEVTGSELVSLLLESQEIKLHKPVFNSVHKRTQDAFSVFEFLDEKGYRQLKVDTKEKDLIPLLSFNSIRAAKEFLGELAGNFHLCTSLCGIYNHSGPCFQYKIKDCFGACIGIEPPDEYNLRVEKAISRFRFEELNCLIIDKGRSRDEKAVIWINHGRFIGFDFISIDVLGEMNLASITDCIKPRPDNRHSRHLINNFLREKKIEKVISLDHSF